MTIAASTFARLKQAAGPKGFSEDPQEIAPHLVEWRSKYQGNTPLLLKPETTAQISAILAICNETHTPIVPQGGNTGLVGGQIPLYGEILLSLARMNRIRRVDAEGRSIVVEAGAILADVQRAADDAGQFFPLSLAAEGSCTIGGNLSTNAGGVNVLRYGSARDLVLGVEVVLADGRVLDLLRSLRKDNTGYDLKQLFIGAEGTLGVITAAALKLFPKPAAHETAFVAVRDPAAAVALLDRLAERHGRSRVRVRTLPRLGLELVLAHIPQTTDPLSAPSPWYVLTEATSAAACFAQGGIPGDALPPRSGRARLRTPSSRRASAQRDATVAAARKPVRGAEAGRRIDQARRLGAGRRDTRAPRRAAAKWLRAWCRVCGRCRSGIWATATSISISACPKAPTATRSSRAGARSRAPSTILFTNSAVRSAPSTASAR